MYVGLTSGLGERQRTTELKDASNGAGASATETRITVFVD
jgi:hypothetical protein